MGDEMEKVEFSSEADEMQEVEFSSEADEMQEVEFWSEAHAMEEVKQVESCSSKKRKSRGYVWEMQDNLNAQKVVFVYRIALTIQADEFVEYRKVLLHWLKLVGKKMQWVEKKWITLDDELQMMTLFAAQLGKLENQLQSEESGQLEVQNKPLADALVHFIFSTPQNYELFEDVVQQCKQYRAGDAHFEIDMATSRTLKDNPLRHVTELILLCHMDELAKLFDDLAGKILHTEPALSSRYRKDVPMEPLNENVPMKSLNENVPIKPDLLTRCHVLRYTVAWCVFNSVVIELDPEYETMLNELRTARLTAGAKPNPETLEALLADEPDPLPLMFPYIYKYANADEMYTSGDLTWYSNNIHGADQIAALVQKLP